MTTEPLLLELIDSWAGVCTLTGSPSPKEWGQHWAPSDKALGFWSGWGKLNSGEKLAGCQSAGGLALALPLGD